LIETLQRYKPCQSWSIAIIETLHYPLVHQAVIVDFNVPCMVINL